MATRSASATTTAVEPPPENSTDTTPEPGTDPTTDSSPGTGPDEGGNATPDDGDDWDDTGVSEPINSRLLPVTAPDHQGINRVVVPSDDGWEPAETDPNPKLVARNEKRVEDLRAAQAKRLEDLKGQTEEPSRPDDASPLEP
jgi:hypothetical protein